jgi:iron only hydrogenase large subunit-like protein
VGSTNAKPPLSAFKGENPPFNFIEGMACSGGCIGGPACLTHELRDAADVDKYGHESKETTIEGALSNALVLDEKK